MSHTIFQVAAVFGVYIALEFLLGRFPLKSVTRRDNGLDLAAFTQASFLVGPLIVYGSAAIESWLLPGMAGRYADVAWWWKLAAFLVFEDMVQYWYHRFTHRFGWMWGFHKFHHTPGYMSVRIIWRNSFLYDLMMPNIWTAGILVYLGFGDVYLWYYLVKLVITMGAHSAVRWDEPLYKYRVLHPVAWVVERTISTPATHFAHHALVEDDGIGHYNGNFGNMLFLWDVLFGTARITRKYPPAYGFATDPGEAPDPWYVLVFYPLFRKRRR